MATTIKLKNGSGAPLAGDLVQGEPALDLTNKRLYTEDSGGSVIEVGTNPTSLTTGTFTSTGVDDNASSTAITIDSSQNTTFAGTITSGDITVTDATPFIRLKDSDVTNGYTQISNVNGNGYIGARNDSANGSFLIGGYGGGTFTEFARWSDAGNLTQENNLTVLGAFTSLGIDDNATSTAITINSSQNVGIGTTDPDSNLHIAGSAAASLRLERNDTTIGNGNSIGSIHFEHQETGYAGICATLSVKAGNNNGNGEFVFENGVAGTVTEKMRIDRNGSVLIGRTDATLGGGNGDDLQIGSGSTGAGLTIHTNSTSNGDIQFADGTVGDSSYRGLIRYSHDNDKLELWTAGARKVTVDSSGNVGIGAASPARLFEVAGNNNAGAKANYLRITDTDTTATAANQQGGIEFYASDTSGGAGVTASMEVLYAGIGGGGEITFNTAATSGAGVSEAMRIDAAGNVGIGTDSPADELHVNATGANVNLRLTRDTNTGARISASDAADSPLIKFEIIDSGSLSEKMRIRDNGQLLLGGTVNSPANVRMVVFGTGNATNVYNTGHTGIHINNNAATAGLDNYGAGLSFGRFGGSSDDNSAMIVPVQTTSDEDHVGLAFLTHNTNTRSNPLNEAMRIDSSGDVSIGTSSCDFQTTNRKVLQVEGPTDALLNLSDGTNHFYLHQRGGGADVWNTANSEMRFGTNNAERMRIDSAGDLLVGNTLGALGLISTTTTEGFGIDASETYVAISRSNNGAAIYLNKPGESTSTAGDFIQCRQDGTNIGEIQYDGADLAIVQVSDQRLKSNIVDSASAGSIIDAMQVRSFDWNDGVHVDYGFVAQELNQAYEPATKVGGDDVDEEPWGIKTQKLIPLLVKEIQDLRARVAQLEGE